MLQLGIKELAKYPFLAETGDYLRDKGFNLEQLSDPDWKPVVEQAYGRIVVATTGQIYGGNIDNPDLEILSFVIAIVEHNISQRKFPGACTREHCFG